MTVPSDSNAPRIEAWSTPRAPPETRVFPALAASVPKLNAYEIKKIDSDYFSES